MKRVIIGLGASALVACAHPKPASEPAPEGTAHTEAAPQKNGKPDLDAMAARESSGLSEQAVVGPDHAFDSKVPASGPPKVSKDGNVAMIEIPIGSGEPMHCQVFAEAIDAGGTIAGVLANSMAHVQIQRVAPWSVEVVKEAPVAFVHALYTTDTPRGKALGELKLAVESDADHPVLCIHDELGYEKTFVKETRAFCDALDFAKKPASVPSFVEIQIATMKGSPVGYSKAMVVTEGAQRRVVESTTILIPVAVNELRVEDDYSIEFIGKDLRLDRGVWVEASGGQVGLNVQAAHEKGGSYHYKGEIQGKKVQGDFKTRDGKALPSSLSSTRELLKRSKGTAPFSYEEASYHPGLDPTRPLTVRYSRGRGEPASTVHEELGKTTSVGTIDDQGLMKSSEMPIGGVTLNLERAFIRGKL